MIHGEIDGDSYFRCPGDECEIWAASGGEYEERSKVCLDCSKCNGKPPLLNQETSPEAVQKSMVSRIERLIMMLDAKTIRLADLEYFEWRLIEVWRSAETEQARLINVRMRFIVQALSQQPE